MVPFKVEVGMSELSEQELLQQRRAHSISGEQLELLGKKAAASWSDGAYSNLTGAVVGIVKSSSVPLSPEQVHRVTEFANTQAYLSEFKKEGAHKIVDFGPEGPANPADVLRDLNDGGGATVMDSGLGDYRRAPEKRASQDADRILSDAFSVKTASGYPENNPYGEVIELRDKLAGAYEHTSAEVSGLEVAYEDISNQLYAQVKEAALTGSTLGQIIQAWSAVNDDPVFVKAAFDQFVPRLFTEQVYHTLDGMSDSLMKTAGKKMVNLDHPLVQHYSDFCNILTKLAGLRLQQEELLDNYKTAEVFMREVMKKESAEGLLPKAYQMYTDNVVPSAEWLSKKLVGSAVPGKVVAALAPPVVAGVGTMHAVNALNDRGYHPMKWVPGSSENEQARAQTRYMYGVQ